MQVISYERITPVMHGGGGYGNTYRFRVEYDNGVTCLSTCERDVASGLSQAGLPIPAELSGPYDIYGHPLNKE